MGRGNLGFVREWFGADSVSRGPPHVKVHENLGLVFGSHCLSAPAQLGVLVFITIERLRGVRVPLAKLAHGVEIPGRQIRIYPLPSVGFARD